MSAGTESQPVGMTGLAARLAGLWRDHRLLVVFLALAMGLRLVFWAYTGRTWEDALIALSSARNFWDGHGLTHHSSEPPILSFTSPLGVLVMVIGEAIGQGLALVKLASIAAAGLSVAFAYGIGCRLKFSWGAQVAMLGYLAVDYLHIFFGMGGMETQLATAIMLGCVYFVIAARFIWLGVFMGLAMWVRPDFIFALAPLGLYVLVTRPIQAVKVAAIALAVYVPWLVFATLYYGSPVPQSVIAKSWSGRLGFANVPLDRAFKWQIEQWANFAPFKEYFLAYRSPLPDTFYLGTVIAFVSLVALGIAWSVRRSLPLVFVAIGILAFLAYRATTVTNSYYAWYLPPYTALMAVMAAAGLTLVARTSRQSAAAIGVLFVACYAAPLPFMMTIDRSVQSEIQVAVRLKSGERLGALMKETDSAVLEPLGYVGFGALNKTIWDYPGIGSRIASREVAVMAVPHVTGLIDRLKPEFAVLRRSELERLQQDYPETAALYQPVERFMSRPDLKMDAFGFSYRLGDNDYTIYRRVNSLPQPDAS